MKKQLFFVIILIIMATWIFFSIKNFTNQNQQSRLIGGDKDAGGCLIGAGYSWCQVKYKCLRVWEEKCEAENIATTSNNIGTTSEKNPISVKPVINSSSTQSIKSCAQMKGVWYSSEKVCEVNQLSASQCKAKGGIFNECASACRHDSTAQVCTMQCVLTCTFR
jgi:hypothetical protein